MTEKNAKVTLDEHGAEAFISSHGLAIILSWTQNVDLDLLAFYKTKDGRTGGVVSDNFPGGNLGNLNEFPFIELSGDAGIHAKSGIHEETLCMNRLDHMEEVYFCTLNYTDLSKEREVAFSEYDGSIMVIDDSGEGVIIPLDAVNKGHIAVIAKIDNRDEKDTKIVNINKIINLETFASTIPGADILVCGD